MNQVGVFQKVRAWVLGNKALVFFILVFSAAMVAVFASVFSPWMAISSPDDAPFYAQNRFVQMMELFISGNAAFTPFHLGNLFAQIALHEVRYIVPVFLFALSGVYYFRTLKADAWAACGGGLFLALSGYMFTLFSAGHLGFFWLIGGFFWAFGLLNRCLDSGRLHHFMLLGAAPMWAYIGQPDVGMLFAAVFVFYALWRFWLARGQLKKVWPKFFVTALVAGLVGMPGIKAVLTQHLAGRDKQIADVMRSETGSAENTSQKHSPERWDFATGWSLPPSDCAEFLVPGVFGNGSFRPPYPFWGKLGSVPEEQEKKPWPNYRQHTVYLGLVTVMMAVIGVLAWWGEVRKFGSSKVPAPSAAPAPAGSPKFQHSEEKEAADFRDVPFWCVIAAGSLLLAMGRYTPCYRLFYALPYMDYLRAPVKFLHFTELSVGLLAGFGLHALLKRERVTDRAARIFFSVAIGFAACLGVASLVALGSKAAMEKSITGMGFGLGQFASALSGYAVYNCFRAVGLAAAVTALIYFWKTQKRRAHLAVCGIVLLGVMDLTAVAMRHVDPRDIRAFHVEHAIVKDILDKTAGRPVNIVNYATRHIGGQDWLNTSFSAYGINNVIPNEGDPNSQERPVAFALQNNQPKFWDVMGVRFILLPRQQAEQLIQQRVVTLIGEYTLGNGTVRKGTAAGGQQTVALLERKAVPFPCVYFDWSGDVPADKQAESLTQPGKAVVTDAPAPPATDTAPTQAVVFSKMRGMRNVFTSHAEMALAKPGLLVWNEHYSPDLTVAIDGKPVPLYQANGVWCAVQVPAGKHTLTCRIRADGWMNLIAAVTSLLVALSPFAARKSRS